MAMDGKYGLVISFRPRRCVMGLDIRSGVLEAFAGQCDSTRLRLSGDRLKDLKLKQPIGVAFDGGFNIYIAMIRAGENLISVSMKTDKVVNVFRIPKPPRRIGFDITTNSIYATVNHGFGKFDLKSRDFSLLIGSLAQMNSSNFHVSVPLDEVELLHAAGFVKIGLYRWMIADPHKHR